MVTAERAFPRAEQIMARLAPLERKPETALADQLHQLLSLPDAALEHAMAEGIRREDALDEDERHRVTMERLRAWLELDREDARIIAGAFDRAAAGLGPEVQTRRIGTERAVIFNGMSFEEFRALVPLLEWLRRPPFDDELLVVSDSAGELAIATGQ